MYKGMKAFRLAICLMLATGMSVGIFDVGGPDGPRATFAQTDTTAPTISSIAITSDTGDEEEVYLDIEVTAEDDATTQTYTVTRLVSLQQTSTDATLSALSLSRVNFGAFASATTSYRANVANSVSLTTVTPTLNDSDASYVIKLGGVTDSDGVIPLSVGSNVITVVVTAEDDSTTKTYSVTVKRAATSISAPDLTIPSVITFSNPFGYSPSFSLSINVVNRGNGSSGSTTLRYYRSADSTITSGDTEVGRDAVGGLAASGRSIEGIDLTAPSTPGTYYYGGCVDAVPDESDTTNNCSPGITWVVPGVTSTDATLSGLSLSDVNFGTFASGTTSYSAQVANSVTETTVTPTVNNSGASYVIKLGGATDSDGTVSLAVGSNVITVVVTAEDTTTTTTYTVTVTRAAPPSSEATLKGLTLSRIDFGTFTSGTESYTASAANSVTETTVTPTLNDSDASYVIKLGGVTDSDGVIPLSVGSNVITIEVTAEDGHTTRIYTLRITRDSVSEPETSAGICDRTSEVQVAILGKLNEGLDAPEITDCSEVTDEDLGGIIGNLTLSNMELSALKSRDFEGLSGLTSLYLDHNNLTTLPEGIFQGLDSLDIELVSNVVEIASRWFSSSSGDGLLDAHRQLGEDTVLEPRSVHQQAHKVSASVQRTPALTQPQRHLEHKVQRAVTTLHSSSDVRPQPHSAEHRLQRVSRPQMHPVLDREVVEAHERLPVPKHRVGGI